MKLKITLLIPLVFVSLSCFGGSDNAEMPLVVQGDSVGQSWLEGSWGITFPVFGGERLDAEVANGYDLVSGAQEVIDSLPTIGHVICNLSYFAHSHYFPFSLNANVDVANEIHPSIIPNSNNDEIIFDVLQIFKDAEKRIILYISCNYLDRASDEVQAAWVEYYTSNFGGNEYLAYEDLVQGFIEYVKDFADGYWLDTTGKLKSQGKLDDFVRMIRATDTTALLTYGGGIALTVDGEDVFVDSDGLDDEDERDYYIKLHEPTDDSDFTNGHIVPLATGAPPNSWAYEEFMIPNMINEPVVEYNGKTVIKHGWFPIRKRWHVPSQDIVFEKEQAYRFVRRITDAGAAITFANTIDYGVENPGFMMPDEMAIMKEINRRLLMDPMMEYLPYTRPAGAKLVGETFPDDFQDIYFPIIPDKEIGIAGFQGAEASSGLPVSYASSNTDVAVIIDKKIYTVAAGTSVITASQAGNSEYAAASDVMQRLTVILGNVQGMNIASNGTATQSSTDFEGEASRAIDGNTDGKWANGSVSHTENEVNPWWQVDLGSDRDISGLTIFGRTDACCTQRLSDYTVYVFDSNGDTTFSRTYTSFPNPSEAIHVGGVQGKVIRIKSNLTDALSIAEVQVFGNPYTLSLKVSDEATNDSIAFALLAINNGYYTTNSQGELSLLLSEGQFPYSLDKKGYYSLAQTLDITKDTALTLQLRAKPQYTLSFKITGDTANSELAGVLLTIDGKNYTTDASGEVSVTLTEDEYDYSLSFASYQTLKQSINLVKDTMLSLHMDNERHRLEFQVEDAQTKVNLPAVTITINDEVYETDALGKLSLDLEGGEYAYVLSKPGYLMLKQSIIIEKDTLVSLKMVKEKYQLEFQVKDAETGEALPAVSITVNASTFESDASGSFSLNILAGEYSYTISKEAYETISESVNVSKDTSLYINLSSIYTEIPDLETNGIIVYPNPVHDQLNVDLSHSEQAVFFVINHTGQKVRSGNIYGGSVSVDVKGLAAGLYLVRVVDDADVYTRSIIKN